MPHLISDRPRLLDLVKGGDDLRAQFRWETINAILYKLGGLTFVVGSVFFFPSLAPLIDIGAWTFFGGSLLYLIVTAHDLIEVGRHRRHRRQPVQGEGLELIAAWAYLLGTLLFVIGSLLFLSFIDRVHAGAWCFIVGSLLFVLGAAVNVLQVPTKSRRGNLQLINLTAVTFVTGSVLFTVASIPYLWHVPDPAEAAVLDRFLASQYLVGSLLFFAGGLTNYLRAYLSIRRRIRAQVVPRDAGPTAQRAATGLSTSLRGR
jgi:hypothetical protein